MSKSSFKARGLFVIAMAVALGIAAKEKFADGYLTRPGPAPLRFLPPWNPAAAISKLPPLPQVDTKGYEAAIAHPKSDGTAASNQGVRLHAGPDLTNPANDGLSAGGTNSLLPEQNISSTNQAWGSSTANDLLTVTPQMLVEYFRPMSNRTNAANVSVWLPVNFMPDASAPNPLSPHSSPPSSATYQIANP